MLTRLLRPVGSMVLAFTLLSCSDGNLVGPAPAGDAALSIAPSSLPPVRISEIHYDNAGTDAGEAVEVSFPAGTDLTGWRIVRYNGSTPTAASVYTSPAPVAGSSETLSALTPSVCGERAVVVVRYPSNGLQNGGNDGLALVNGTTVVELLSYEGVFTAGSTAGPAAGMTSTDIGAEQTGSATLDPVGASLQRSGSGTWARSAVNSFGACNDADGGVPPGEPGAVASVAVSPAGVEVSVGASTTLGARALDSAGQQVPGVAFTWTSAAPAVATVSESGVVTGVAAGSATITATSAGGVAGSATVTVVTGTAGARVTINGRRFDEALPVGFQDQLFPTLRSATNTVVSTTFTWTSETPQIATVDARGVITGLSAGTATIRATAADGTTGTASVLVEVAPAGDASLYKSALMLGVPTDATPANDLRVSRPQYDLSYDKSRNIPNWVAYQLSKASRGDMPGYRCDCFATDPRVTGADEAGITTADYTGSGFDRGHMVRSNDRELGRYDQATTYYLSNIVPQYAANNQGRWGDLEAHLQAVAEGPGLPEVYIFAGARGEARRIANGRIAVPTHVWKVALVLPAGTSPASIDDASDIIDIIAVDMPNVADLPRDGNWRAHSTTVDAIEAATGYDVLSALPNRLEQVLESGTRAPVARTDGPYIALEGSAVQLSGSASTDPDGDAITYAWEFGDGSTGTGAAPTHTYGDNGTYLVKLTVSDVYGAESSVTTSVVVANGDPAVHVFAGATLLAGERYTGSTSFTDPGADEWTATVDYGDGSGVRPLSISGRGMELSHTYTTAGTYTVTVTVRDDDGGVGTQTVRVTVQSPAEAIGGLEALVSTLARTGSLNRGNAMALTAKLRAASASLARGDETPAVNQLEAFVNQVEALVGSDRLSQAEASGMTAAAARIIRSINQ